MSDNNLTNEQKAISLDNLNVVKIKMEEHNSSPTAHAELFSQFGKKVVAERIRVPDKTDYGLTNNAN